MATGIHSSRKSKMRSDKNKDKEKVILVTSAKYLNDFNITLIFSDGKKRIVDFLPLFHKYVKGDNLKYFNIETFKKFFVKNGNIFWGKNEDVIFTIDELYDELEGEEEVLFIV
jgi:hypothetical protein